MFAGSFIEVKKKKCLQTTGVYRIPAALLAAAGKLWRTQIVDQGKHTKGGVDKTDVA